MSPEVIIGGAK